jgi:hypothetical protein
MKVFISYAREDRKTALKLYHDLKKAGDWFFEGVERVD